MSRVSHVTTFWNSQSVNDVKYVFLRLSISVNSSLSFCWGSFAKVSYFLVCLLNLCFEFAVVLQN